MSQARSLWAYVRESPEFVFRFNKWLFFFLIPWTLLLALPGSPLVALGRQVGYVTLISHIALLLGAWSTMQAARVEIRQQEMERKRRQENP